MFILTEKSSGGVYAVKNKGGNGRTVHMFEQEADAERYLHLLMADDYKRPLELMEIDQDAVAFNCDKFGYSYSVVKKDVLIIP